MDTSKEHIEAQLAAYIDGELSDSERLDIERHLLRHPHHRRLLDELMQVRDLLHNLPRVKAPVELNESLVGQLERSSLLDPEADRHADASIRIRRWPQFAAVAAVIFLALGLGMVVYYVLPASTSNRPDLAHNDPSRHVPSDPIARELERAKLAEDLNKARAGDSAGAHTNGAGARIADAGSTNDAVVRRNVDFAGKSGSATTNNYTDTAKQAPLDDTRAGIANAAPPAKPLVTGRDVETFRKQLRGLRAGEGFAVDQPALVLYVSAENLRQADQQIIQYFNQNQIEYKAEDARANAWASALDARRHESLNRYEADKASGYVAESKADQHSAAPAALAKTLNELDGASSKTRQGATISADAKQEATPADSAFSGAVPAAPAISGGAQTRAITMVERGVDESDTGFKRQEQQKELADKGDRNARDDRQQRDAQRTRGAVPGVVRSDGTAPAQGGAGAGAGTGPGNTTAEVRPLQSSQDQLTPDKKDKTILATPPTAEKSNVGGQFSLKPSAVASSPLQQSSVRLAKMNRRQAAALASLLQQDGQNAQVIEPEHRDQLGAAGKGLSLAFAGNKAPANKAIGKDLTDPAQADPAADQPRSTQPNAPVASAPATLPATAPAPSAPAALVNAPEPATRPASASEVAARTLTDEESIQVLIVLQSPPAASAPAELNLTRPATMEAEKAR